MTNLCHCDQDLRRVGVEVSSTAASFFVSQLRIEPISFADDLRVFFSFYILVRWIWTEFPGGWPIMHLRQTPRHSTFCQVRTAKCLSRGDWQFNLGSRLSRGQKIPADDREVAWEMNLHESEEISPDLLQTGRGKDNWTYLGRGRTSLWQMTS